MNDEEKKKLCTNKFFIKPYVNHYNSYEVTNFNLVESLCNLRNLKININMQMCIVLSTLMKYLSMLVLRLTNIFLIDCINLADLNQTLVICYLDFDARMHKSVLKLSRFLSVLSLISLFSG